MNSSGYACKESVSVRVIVQLYITPFLPLQVSDEFDYKELGAEKSGRDAYGAVWREAWKEAMWNEAKTGLPHIERSADKWGRVADGSEWHEKW
jgi:hypothetical protein